jgi:hypothetical protein
MTDRGVEALLADGWKLILAEKPKPEQDDPEQSKRFLEAAKAVGADETEKGAERAFKSVVKPRKPK